MDISQTSIDTLLLKIGNLLDRMIIVANQIIKLDKKPEKHRGLQKKIQKTIQKFRELNDETSLLQIAMQDNIASVIGTSEKAQRIGTFVEFFGNVKRSALELKAAIDCQKNK
jgi:uncharacterized protein YdhG (YjbR/CyaY superfamily)